MNSINQLIAKVNPHPESATGEQTTRQRQARMLNWIFLFIILFAISTLLIVLFFNPHHDEERNLYALFIGGLGTFITFTYLLNRAGHYTLSAALLVLSAAAIPWAALLFDPSILQGDFVPLIYVTFSIFISSIFLPIYITFGLAVLQFAGVTLTFVLNPAAAATFNWFSFLAYIFLITIFSMLANHIIHINMIQIAEQSHQLRLNEAQLREQSIRDYLTNLFNRRYLEETLRREIQRAKRKQVPLGLIMLDVDGFKRINDTLGHAAGDVVLQELGKFLEGHIRQSDIACRYGGDEFVLVMPDASLEVILERTRVLLDSAKQLKTPIPISLSMGIAVFPDNGMDGETLLKSADNALYEAKHTGGDRVA